MVLQGETGSAELLRSHFLIPKISIYLKKNYSCLQLDTYWTYELCHGRHVKQFHEVKAGVPVCTFTAAYHFWSLVF